MFYKFVCLQLLNIKQIFSSLTCLTSSVCFPKIISFANRRERLFMDAHPEMYSGGSWDSLVVNQRFIAIYSPLIFLCGRLIVPNQRFMVVYYGLSLIAVRESLRIQR